MASWLFSARHLLESLPSLELPLLKDFGPAGVFWPLPGQNDEIECAYFDSDAASAFAQDVDSLAGDWIRHEFRSGCSGACKCRKENRGSFMCVRISHRDHSACERSQEQAHEAIRTQNGCLVIKAGRGSSSRPTLICKVKRQKNDCNFVDKFVVEAKSAPSQNVGHEPLRDDAPACPMAKTVASCCGHCSTLAASIPVQKKAGFQAEMRAWKSTFEVTRQRVADDWKARRIPNLGNEELSALLLSKIEALERNCGSCASEQGLWGRTPLGKKLEANIAAKGRNVRFFNKHPRSQPNTDVEDDGSQNCSSSFSVEDDVPSENESSATSEPQAESSTGDSSAP